MPYQIRKIRNQNFYTVTNKISGRVHSKHTTKQNAEKQVRLMETIDAKKWNK